jgi:FMN hydrolase / 5-amino-6-(5-phospho-D-ribitylamino)uracil phosphatase
MSKHRAHSLDAAASVIKLVTFDLDDTLWDVRPALQKAEAAQWQWLAQHYPTLALSASDPTLNQRRRDLISRQPELIHNISRFRQTFITELLMDAGISPSEAHQAGAAAFAAFMAHRHDVGLFETAAPVLKALSQKYLIGALTNGNADVYRTPLAPYFNFAFKAEEVGASKPHPEMFHRALAHTDTHPQQVIHVGDSHTHDIIGAKNAGVLAIWFNRHGEKNAEDTTSDAADATITCLTELPEVISGFDRSR